ncbi:hypothetical protein [Mycolicibacterium sp.]|uniref:hypothetical protein n=1 Tax=Mycolicibacterium sp. TaxID=2320850 RepID=UPI000940088F|nr:hypothetical protein EB73_34985 [Mycobacterium sp. SWH-M3]
MGVVHEYFVLNDDEHAAALLGSFGDGVLGVEPVTELASLEALLLGLNPGLESSSALMNRPDHAVMIAADADQPENVNVVVTKIADHTTALIASATPEQLAAAMQPWSQTEEFFGSVSANELAEMIDGLAALFRDAIHRGEHVYVRTSC